MYQYGNQQQNIAHPQPQHVPRQIINPNQDQGHRYQQQFPQQSNPQFQQSQQYYNNEQAAPAGQPQGAGAGAGNVPNSGGFGPYGNFFNEAIANVAFKQQADFNQRIVSNYLSQYNELGYYFKVSNTYVMKKLLLVLFPYRNKSWTRLVMDASDQANPNAAPMEVYAPPVTDVNAPDLYIPLMGFVTYILLWVIFAGIKGEFHPELFGRASSTSMFTSILDVAILQLGLYLLGCDSKIWDLVAFSGYKYVPILTLLLFKNLIGGHWLVYYGFSLAVYFSLAFFLLRSLRHLILPGNGMNAAQTISSKQRKLRIQFLFFYCFPVQLLFVYWMS